MLMTVLPSGRTLDIEPGESLLDALKRHAEPISYSCQDGRCGLCRCSVSSLDRAGSLLPASLDDGSARSVLACQTRPKTECLVELADSENTYVVPAQIATARVLSVRPLAARVTEIVLQPNKPLRFAAGQHFEFKFGTELIRHLSMASSPADPEVRVHVQHHPYGRLSEYVKNGLKVGDVAKLRGPLGTVYLRQRCGAPIVCISNNTGLGPMLALLGSIAQAAVPNRVFVYAGFTLVEDVYGLDELRELTSKIRGHVRTQVVTASGPVNRKEVRGLLTDALANGLSRIKGSRSYLFGSPHAVEAVARFLRREGFPAEQIHAEPFVYSSD